ncbi:hypothetical protein HPG69_002231 [Diceros bicornis minor]|uniref:Peptidase S1 domain-containing protein n=1 Tax=Diceros bicornis minor TaxID=77932 RepID=A0A7J7FCU7_DICBM|nr:hypothetical protein HPG69_002231 [Diceros bicornis minor]
MGTPVLAGPIFPTAQNPTSSTPTYPHPEADWDHSFKLPGLLVGTYHVSGSSTERPNTTWHLELMFWMLQSSSSPGRSGDTREDQTQMTSGLSLLIPNINPVCQHVRLKQELRTRPALLMSDGDLSLGITRQARIAAQEHAGPLLGGCWLEQSPLSTTRAPLRPAFLCPVPHSSLWLHANSRQVESSFRENPRGHEANPHSCPCLAFLRIQTPETKKAVGVPFSSLLGKERSSAWPHPLSTPHREPSSRGCRPGPPSDTEELFRGQGSFGETGGQVSARGLLKKGADQRWHRKEAEVMLQSPECTGHKFTVLPRDSQALSMTEHPESAPETAIQARLPRSRGLGDVQPQGPIPEDSGGPFLCNNMSQGIVSFGKNNGKHPRVFTRVSSSLPLIKSIMLQVQGPD